MPPAVHTHTHTTNHTQSHTHTKMAQHGQISLILLYVFQNLPTLLEDHSNDLESKATTSTLILPKMHNNLGGNRKPS